MRLDVCLVPLRASEPPGDDLISRAITLRGAIDIESFAGRIEPAETQRRRREVELAVETFRFEPRNLGAPCDRLRPILFLARFGKNAEGGKRIVMELQNFAGSAGGSIEILFCHHGGGVFKQIRFAPATIRLRAVAQQRPTKSEPKEK